MKFNINKNELLKALKIVSKSISNTTSLPIMTGIYISAESGKLTLIGMSEKQSIRLYIPALVDKEGSSIIPSKILLNVINALPDATVTIEIHDVAHITCDNASFNLPIFNIEDYPTFPEITSEQTISIPFNQFNTIASYASQTVSKNETNIAATGIYLETEDNVLSIVSTDSYRVTLGTISLENLPNNFKVIVSPEFINNICSLPAEDEIIEIGIAGSQIIFTHNNVTLISRTIEATFFPYKNFFKQDMTTKVIFSNKEIVTAIKRVTAISGNGSSIKLDISKDANITTITANDKENGSAQEIISCEVIGESLVIGFNSDYLLTGINYAGEDQIIFEAKAPESPATVKPVQNENNIYLLTPVKL